MNRQRTYTFETEAVSWPPNAGTTYIVETEAVSWPPNAGKMVVEVEEAPAIVEGGAQE